MPKMTILVGLPGSGKSTWLAENAGNAHVVSLDNVIEELAAKDGIGYNEAWHKHVNHANTIMNQRFKQAVNDGKDIIVDKTNLTVKTRGRTMRSAPGYRYEAVLFDIDDAEIDRRLVKREKETGKSIPQTVIENFRKSFVTPSINEGFFKVRVIRD